MANDISETLFESIDTIVSARISGLPYDQTIYGYITDITQRSFGIYKIKYDGIDITVYSDNTDYNIDDYVCVTIPKANYSDKKYIIGKIIPQIVDPPRTRPFENYVQCTENLINSPERERQIMALGGGSANGSQTLIFSKSFIGEDSQKYGGYDFLGLKLDISADLYNYTINTISGTYCIKIQMTVIDQKTTKEAISQSDTKLTYVLDFNDMIISDFYATSGFCNQQKVFNIKDLLIKRIDIYLVQDGNFKSNLNEDITKEDNFLISCKNIELSFGYEGIYDDFSKGKVFIYTTEGLLYNLTEKITKQAYSRIVKYINGQIKVYENKEGSGYTYCWYRYDINSDIIHTQLGGLSSYEQLEGSEYLNSSIILPLILNKGLINQRYRLAVSQNSFDWIYSDALIFTNSINVKNAEIMDSLIGFTAITTGENKDLFYIYGPDNLAINEADTLKTYHIRLGYMASSSSRTLKPGDIIQWNFPTSNTMLIPVGGTNGSYTLGQYDLDEDNTYLFPFKIKNLYNQNYTQNIINFRLILQENEGMTTELELNKELFFGTSGASGTDYIFTLELYDQYNQRTQAIEENNNKITGQYYIIPHLYDYNMNDQLNINNKQLPTIQYNWLNETTTLATNEDLTLNLENIPTEANKRIIKARIDSLNIETYLPIGTKNNSLYEYIEGCKTITYDITGKKPLYYKNPYKIVSIGGSIVKDVEWKIENEENSIYQLRNDIIIAPSAYSENPESICVIGSILNEKNEKENIWIQPIIILQNKYPSAMLNNEQNKIQIQNDIIIKNNLVGKITPNNGGIFICDTEDNQTGLFVYDKNKQLIKITTDGDIQINSAIALGQYQKGISTLVNEGSSVIPVYFNNGIPKACSVDSMVVGSADHADSASIADKLNLTNPIGSASVPVYFTADGIPEACTIINTLQNQITELEARITVLENKK